MLITRVELENIKNHESGCFEFGPGVTAICGPNGAGKTTILEAIAWSLFDQLPYKKEDFLKRGAKKGSARVTLVSAIDGREYTVYRDTGAGYYVYDPITKIRLVEQKNQVAVWLKQHLGVEPAADLKSLFASTIGVPQGTFTVDFADQPAKRKISFDKVLRVDEYQRSSDDLRALVRLLESRDADLREELARLEGEVAILDSLLEDKSRCELDIERLKRSLAEAEQERERARGEAERLAELRRSIERMTTEAASLTARIEEINRRRAIIADQVARSRRASEAVAISFAGFTAYNEANARLQEMELQAAQRDALKKNLAEKERELFRVETTLQNDREKLRQLEADRDELQRLAPLVVEQENIESRLAVLRNSIAELASLAKTKEAVEREIAALRAEYSSLSKQAEEAASLKQQAESAPQMELKRKRLESLLRENQIALERLSERKKESKRVSDAIARLTGEIKTLEREMTTGLAAERLAAALPQLEAADQAAMEEIARLKAGVERDQKILAGIKGGLCPLLSERCLNMKEGQSLDQFFKFQIGTEREQLSQLEQKRKEARRELEAAKAALKAASALDSQRTQLSRFKQDIEIERRDAARLEKEISEITVDEKTVGSLSERLAALDQQLQRAQAARSKYESLEVIRERLERVKIEGTEKKNALAEIEDRQAALSGSQKEMDEAEARLVSLDDPRGRCRLLQSGLSKEKQLRASLDALAKREALLLAESRELTQQLEAHAALDQQVMSERERRGACEKDYRAHIENQPVAALLESRETELKTIEDELETSAAQSQALLQALREAQAGYDEQVYAAVKAKLEEMINLAASLASELSGASARLANLSEAIDRLMQSKLRMIEMAKEKNRCDQLLSLSDFIRDLLKRAGPFITEAHLQSISIEANQLYRDITGNPMVTLRWDMGYEIVLEEEGHERSFASLSGGEQMAAALAVRLALLKELSDMRIAFFDEPTTNMDEERRRNLAQQIGRIKDFDQLFVISHDDAFEGFTDQVVSVRSAMEEV